MWLEKNSSHSLESEKRRIADGHIQVLVHCRPGAVAASSASNNRDCNVLRSSEFGSLLLVTPGRLHELSFAILRILENSGFLLKESVLSN